MQLEILFACFNNLANAAQFGSVAIDRTNLQASAQRARANQSLSIATAMLLLVLCLIYLLSDQFLHVAMPPQPGARDPTGLRERSEERGGSQHGIDIDNTALLSMSKAINSHRGAPAAGAAPSASVAHPQASSCVPKDTHEQEMRKQQRLLEEEHEKQLNKRDVALEDHISEIHRSYKLKFEELRSKWETH